MKLLTYSRPFRTVLTRTYASFSEVIKDTKNITLNGTEYQLDSSTNINKRILAHVGRNLHLQEHHPLCFLRQRIVKYLQSRFQNRAGNPQFSEYNNLNPVVAIADNFDNLLVPEDHPSRKPTDSYYINGDYMLRAHMTCHDKRLINSGLDNFVLIGDVYRRDSIDKSHFSIFHQVDAVRLRTEHELFNNIKDIDLVSLFENSTRNPTKQECHTLEALKLMEFELKATVVGLMEALFGKGVKHRWVEAFFPFTHPSWELEIEFNGQWMEVVGCGILEQKILQNAGAGYKIGWAFGLGLERIAMKLYNIPHIRIFWSQDTGFYAQFKGKKFNEAISFKPLSQQPACVNNISFWIPDNFEENNFYELARHIGGEMIELIELVDQFTHPKTKRKSYCYKIVYRHMERSLTQEEVNVIHKNLEDSAIKELLVEVR